MSALTSETVLDVLAKRDALRPCPGCGQRDWAFMDAAEGYAALSVMPTGDEGSPRLPPVAHPSNLTFLHQLRIHASALDQDLGAVLVAGGAR